MEGCISHGKPVVHVIAGPNGCGKTTFAESFLPSQGCGVFINADNVALELEPDAPDSVSMSAGRRMLELIDHHANTHTSFGFETTLSGVNHPFALLKRLAQDDYDIKLYYLWLRSVDLCLLRIADRVDQGGHNIPEEVVRRRYTKSIRNLFLRCRVLVDYFALIDNSGPNPIIIATGTAAEHQIVRPELLATFENLGGVNINGDQT